MENDPKTNFMDLESFMIMPIQRIPRYVLLLQDLLKYTSETHPDYSSIKSALEKCKEMAEKINKSNKDWENLMKVIAIQQKLDPPTEVRYIIRTLTL